MKHVLVVDDNAANLTLARENLKEHYKVSVVTSGEQAIMFLDKKTPDLILLDIYMPDMDGIETFRRMKEREGFHIPVIMLTALADADLESECRRMGAANFMAKPFVPAAMEQKIEAALEGVC